MPYRLFSFIFCLLAFSLLFLGCENLSESTAQDIYSESVMVETFENIVATDSICATVSSFEQAQTSIIDNMHLPVETDAETFPSEPTDSKHEKTSYESPNTFVDEATAMQPTHTAPTGIEDDWCGGEF